MKKDTGLFLIKADKNIMKSESLVFAIIKRRVVSSNK
jgi:hypothetical protein